MADAAHVILTSNHKELTGKFLVDDDVLRSVGITDLTKYAVDPSAQLLPDFFV
jgi:citronellol/citronellal dehydrogenase